MRAKYLAVIVFEKKRLELFYADGLFVELVVQKGVLFSESSKLSLLLCDCFPILADCSLGLLEQLNFLLDL
jgi:hypothetical protein